MGGDETVITTIKVLEDEDKRPYLTFIWGPRMGELVGLEKPVTIVGRMPECDLWIEDSAISRKHFSVELQGSKAFLKDLGSTNGTLVNGEKVIQHPLSDGDKIQISKDTILEFTYLDETRRMSEKMRYEMGVMDPVTNTYNKRFFLGRIREEFSFSKRAKRDLSLIIFDLDHFKIVNDKYGHLAGDFVLQKIGSVVLKTIRTHDILARYGGEEFVVLMRDTTCQNAVNLAERLRKVIEETEFIYENQRLPISISCGIATLDETQTDHRSLIGDADRVLYQAKEEGRNRVKGPCDSKI